MTIKIGGISWYAREDYAACRAIMADKDVLPVSYEDWQKKADAQAKVWENKGFRIIRVYLKAEEFRAWCTARHLHIDAKARTLFATEEARRLATN